jgi:hypothetical protein
MFLQITARGNYTCHDIFNWIINLVSVVILEMPCYFFGIISHMVDMERLLKLMIGHVIIEQTVIK